MLIRTLAGLAACAFLLGACQHDGAPEPRDEAKATPTVDRTTRLQALEAEMARVGERHVWSLRLFQDHRTMRRVFVDRGDLFVELFDHEERTFKVLCLNLTDGVARWEHTLGEYPLAARPAGGEGRVVFLLEGPGGMMVLERATGIPFERQRVMPRTYPHRYAAAAAESVYVTSLATSQLHALSAKDGLNGWSVHLDGAPVAGPQKVARLAGEMLVVANNRGKIFGIPAADWNNLRPTEGVWSYECLGNVVAEPTVAVTVEKSGAKAHAIVPCQDTGVYCLDAASGTERWRYGGTLPFESKALVAGGRVFVRDAERMHVLDLSSGQAAWPATAGSEVGYAHEAALSLLSGDERRSYLLFPGQGVARFDAADGTPLAQAKLSSFDHLLVCPEANRLVGLSPDGFVVAFE